ncbi:MAG TPA: hypothetical protein DDY81_08685 [Clostridiales bacterium]|nr:hypothetical protein [Clostridiales bacterium]HBK03281.1 hypothetical protein [Clostridiales bacterium]
MLGGFALRLNGQELLDTDTRSKKAWILLAYLICQRENTVPQKKLIDLLWGEEPNSVNPENALRITMHRTRALLEQFSPAAGRSMIQRRRGGYQWGVPVEEVDAEVFERLCRQKTEDPQQRLDNLLKALDIYKGDFLPRQSAEVWVIPISTYLHNLYLSSAREAVDLLSAQGRTKEAMEICRRAIRLEPYSETFCQILMQMLAGSGDRKGAAEVFETLNKRLFDDFGITPSEETRAVYRAAVYAPEDRLLSMDDVMSNLSESDAQPGALQCDYDYFRILCFAASRTMSRSGEAAHVVLVNLAAAEKAFPRSSVDRIMGQLSQQIRLNLRRGDAFCQCTVSQFAILLPGTSYEDTQKICDRILKAFHRAYPYINANVSYLIRPLAADSEE